MVSNNNEIFPFSPLHHQHQPNITETRQDESMNSCCICKILTAPSVLYVKAETEICQNMQHCLQSLPLKGAKPGVAAVRSEMLLMMTLS